MKRNDLFGSDLQWIENWVQRIESISGLKCLRVRQVWDKPSFTKKELINAYEEDCGWFKGVANEISRLCPINSKKYPWLSDE